MTPDIRLVESCDGQRSVLVLDSLDCRVDIWVLAGNFLVIEAPRWGVLIDFN